MVNSSLQLSAWFVLSLRSLVHSVSKFVWSSYVCVFSVVELLMWASKRLQSLGSVSRDCSRVSVSLGVQIYAIELGWVSHRALIETIYCC